MLINSKFYQIPTLDSVSKVADTTRLVVFTPELTLQNQELLNKMLKSTNLKQTEFLQIIIDNDVAPVKFLSNAHKDLKIISFNCDMASMGLQVNVKRYHPFHIHDHELVMVDDLESIGSEVHLKKYIWNLFKTWFVNT